MDIATAERELVERVARFVKAELKRADMTYEQLAERMDVPLGTMKSWVRRGLLQLRECLGDG